ncbi:MAG: hypothetical protein Q9221_006078 [Calogaya cf. arnoldii]
MDLADESKMGPTPERKVTRTALRREKRKKQRRDNRTTHTGSHKKSMADDLATTRKAGARYFNELCQKDYHLLAGPTKAQLQKFFGKRPCSRADLGPDALAELVEWESMTPTEGTREFDIEMKRGRVMDDNHFGRARQLQESELEHEAAKRSQGLGRAQQLYKHRPVAPLYNHKGNVLSEAEKDRIEQKEIDRFWGYDDAVEEEGGVGLHGDEQAASSAEDDSDDGLENIDDFERGGVALNMERSNTEEKSAFMAMALPYRPYPNIAGSASMEEQNNSSKACIINDTSLAFRPR